MAVSVTAQGHRDILGLWAGGEGGGDAKDWLRVLTELNNRGGQRRPDARLRQLKTCWKRYGEVQDSRPGLRRSLATAGDCLRLSRETASTS
ncbi:transposase [Streptomyces sp. NPDC056254]|uniref:transposase n=1 Tax=Streptomyces sp. NPDC056254 TaxID=3345763 RepID=UPI0035E0E411